MRARYLRTDKTMEDFPELINEKQAKRTRRRYPQYELETDVETSCLSLKYV